MLCIFTWCTHPPPCFLHCLLKLVSRRFEDIAGLEDAKSVLQEALVMPLLMPELFTGIRRPVKVSHNEWRLSCSGFHPPRSCVPAPRLDARCWHQGEGGQWHVQPDGGMLLAVDKLAYLSNNGLCCSF